jgi:hypothetical protein
MTYLFKHFNRYGLFLAPVLVAMLIAGAVMTPAAKAGPGPAVVADTVQGSLTAAYGTACTSATCVVMPVVAIAGSAAWQITGTWTATLQFEGTVDGTNWYAIAVLPAGSTSTQRVVAISTASNGIYQMNVAGLAAARVRCSAFSSGTAVVTGRRSAAMAPPQ